LRDVSHYAVSRDADTSLTGGEGANHSINLVCVNADSVAHFRSEIGEAFFHDRYNIGSWWWEMPEFPDRWLTAFDPFDEIWVGTQYIAAAIAKKSPVPVVLVPPIVNVGFVRPVAKGYFDLPVDETTYLYMFDFLSVFERKNPLGAIEAFQRAFRSDERVRLVLKFMNASYDAAGLERVMTAAGSDRRITVIDDYLSREDKNRLIACCDAYISLHRSEGFGFTPAEAMAMGRPVVATGWSGNMDYMTGSNSFVVRYKLVDLVADAGPYEAGQHWAEPDLDDAARALRIIRDEPDYARSLGEQGRVDIRSHFSSATAARIAGDRIDLIESRRRSKVRA
jgi:glycosyltransferase involved in cell wall biosynthesis